MRLLLIILLLLPIPSFGQQYLRPDGNVLQGWTSCTYTTIDEVTPSDADYATNNDLCTASLVVKVYEGVNVKNTWSGSLTSSYTTYSFTFSRPDDFNNLSLRFTVNGNNCDEEDPQSLSNDFWVSMSNPSNTPATGTYTCRFRARMSVNIIPDPNDVRLSWAEIEVPSGESSTNVMIFGDQ